MPSKSSQRNRNASYSQRASLNEVKQLCTAIEDEKRNNGQILIALCYSRVSVDSFEDTYKSGWLFNRSNKRILPTTPKHLDEAVSRACALAQRKKKLMLLVSPYVASISFSIPRTFHMITVYRCGDLPREKRGPNGEDQLLIHDSSTFCDIPLRQWEDRPRNLRKRQLCFLGNIFLNLDLNDINGEINLPYLSVDGKERLVYAMRGLHPSSSEQSSFWDKWKGAIAIILGGIAGVTKFKAGIKLTGAGLYCSHWLGLEIFGGYLSTSAYVAAAIPAGALAFGTAAAVYFIPWDTLWEYFKRLTGSLWDTLAGIWDWIKQQLSSLRNVTEELPSRPPSYASFESA